MLQIKESFDPHSENFILQIFSNSINYFPQKISQGGLIKVSIFGGKSSGSQKKYVGGGEENEPRSHQEDYTRNSSESSDQIPKSHDWGKTGVTSKGVIDVFWEFGGEMYSCRLVGFVQNDDDNIYMEAVCMQLVCNRTFVLLNQKMQGGVQADESNGQKPSKLRIRINTNHLKFLCVVDHDSNIEGLAEKIKQVYSNILNQKKHPDRFKHVIGVEDITTNGYYLPLNELAGDLLSDLDEIDCQIKISAPMEQKHPTQSHETIPHFHTKRPSTHNPPEKPAKKLKAEPEPIPKSQDPANTKFHDPVTIKSQQNQHQQPFDAPKSLKAKSDSLQSKPATGKEEKSVKDKNWQEKSSKEELTIVGRKKKQKTKKVEESSNSQFHGLTQPEIDQLLRQINLDHK